MVAISADLPSFRLVLSALHRVHDVVLVIKPIAGPLRWDLFWKNPVRVAWKRLAGLVTQWRRKRLHGLVQQRYGNQMALPEDTLEVEVESGSFNSQRVEKLIEDTQPDVLFVFGAPLLKERIFDLPKLGSVNLHLGIAPEYRGENTLFWALRKQDPEGLGITFHRIDAGIDTGKVLAHGYPALQGTEGEPEIWLGCLELASRMVGSVVGEMKEGHAIEKGTFYPLGSRTPLEDFKEWISPWCPPRREERVVS